MALSNTFPMVSLNDKWRLILSRTHRVALGLVGGYFLTDGYIAFLSAGLPRVGMPPAEAVYFGLLTGLVLFVGLAVWVASTRFIGRLTIATLVLSSTLILAAPRIALTGA